MDQLKKKNKYNYDSNANLISLIKKTDSYSSMYELANDLTISCTNIIDERHVTRSTQTDNNDFAELKNIKNLYIDLNRVKYIKEYIIIIYIYI